LLKTKPESSHQEVMAQEQNRESEDEFE